MAKLFYQQDCDLGALKGKKVAIVGYGSQGHAHALNLKESGVDVVVGLNAGNPDAEKAKAAGLETALTADAAKMAQIIVVLVPDELGPIIFENDIKPNLSAGDYLMFAHGFNIHYNQIQPPDFLDVIMVAPKGPGHTVRTQFQEGKGVPSLVAVYQDKSGKARDYALAYAAGLGAGRAGILETTFKEETETDLFGEQAVLCGGVTELMKAGFETLVEAGYEPEMAYFECVHEMKLIIDLVNSGGFEMMRYSVSNTAEYGDYTAGRKVIGKDTRKAMKRILSDIQDGTFASEFIQEFNAGGQARFLATRRKESEHLLVKVGQELRKMMAWLKK